MKLQEENSSQLTVVVDVRARHQFIDAAAPFLFNAVQIVNGHHRVVFAVEEREVGRDVELGIKLHNGKL